jgi:hypothetical protein
MSECAAIPNLETGHTFLPTLAWQPPASTSWLEQEQVDTGRGDAQWQSFAIIKTGISLALKTVHFHGSWHLYC